MKRFYLLPILAAALLWACTPENTVNDPEKQSGGQTDDPSAEMPSDPSENTDPDPGVSEDPGTTVDLTPEAWYETNYWERTDREKIGLRGKVKKWHNDGYNYTEYEYDEAGRLLYARQVDKESQRGEWLEKRTYDEQGRLILKDYGRTKEVGGYDYDAFAGVREVTEYEYENAGKYVWVDPNTIDSRTFVNFLGPDNRVPVENIIKGLSAMRISSWIGGFGEKGYREFEYTFSDDGLIIHYSSYSVEYDCYDDVEGDVIGEVSTYEYSPIVYQGDYP